MAGKVHQSIPIVDDEEFDSSAHTADMSISYRSGSVFTDHHQYSSSTRKLSSCMKVATQRESLISISSTATPTITEAIFEDSDTDLNNHIKTVQFGTVAFREYTSIELSDNPSSEYDNMCSIQQCIYIYVDVVHIMSLYIYFSSYCVSSTFHLITHVTCDSSL